MNYYDCEERILVLDEKIAFLKRELRRLLRRNGPAGYGGASFSNEIHAPRNQQEAINALNEIADLQAEIAELEAQRDEVKAMNAKVIEGIRKMKSLDNQVVYLRDVCHFRLADIAELLDYSYDQIKKVSAKNKKEPR